MPIVIPDTVYHKHFSNDTGENSLNGVNVIAVQRAEKQDIRPLEMAIVNLMPNKVDTERQLFRLLSQSPLQINISLVCMGTHHSTHTPDEYLKNAYTSLEEIQNKKFDGMIITGAPVETMDFEKVDYWSELCDLMDYSKQNVFATLHTCWGAMAGLYHHFKIPKVNFDKKLFGVFPQQIVCDENNLLNGADDTIMIPHSRWAGSDVRAIENDKRLQVILDSPQTGPSLVSAFNGRQLFMFGHPEYDRDTLKGEYERDIQKGITITPPQNYFKDNAPEKGPVMTWSAHAHLLARNWIKMIYEQTPYELKNLKALGCEVKTSQPNFEEKNLAKTKQNG